MKRVAAVALLILALATGPRAIAATSPPKEHFVEAHGVRLEYLDWGGKGPALIFIPGIGDSAHVFDDIAPQFSDRFHVLAYSRRGCGESEIKGPYDKATLTADLISLMDKLGLRKAALVGHSAAGDELTEMGSRYPSRVLKLIYIDAAYDWSSPQFKALLRAIPTRGFEIPKVATSSLTAYLAYQQSTTYRSIADLSRVEGEIKARISIDRDGRITPRPGALLISQYFSALVSNSPGDYSQVHRPALAIYAAHSFLFSMAVTPLQRRLASEFDEKYWLPFQRVSIANFETKMRGGQVSAVPGTNHVTVFIERRDLIVRTVRSFLLTGANLSRRGKSR